MITKWLRRLLANSLYEDVRGCSKCEWTGTGFDDYVPCEEHKNHIDLHNALVSGL